MIDAEDIEADDVDDSLTWDLARPTERGVSVLVRAGDSDASAGTTQFVASTDDEDRAGDIVRQDWRLRNFRRNPVILDNHSSMRVVGRATSVVNRKTETGRQRLEVDVLWDLSHPDPSIRGVGHQHLNGFRSAGSVGFRPGKRTMRNKLPTDHPAYKEPTKIERPWGTYEIVGEFLEQNELMEFSSATIPMNPEAAHRHYVDRMAELDPGDVAGRTAVTVETLPAAVAADLAEYLRDPAKRAAAVGLIWPDILDLMRTDPTARRILQALQIPAGPPAPTSFEALVARHLEQR